MASFLISLFFLLTLSISSALSSSPTTIHLPLQCSSTLKNPYSSPNLNPISKPVTQQIPLEILARILIPPVEKKVTLPITQSNSHEFVISLSFGTPPQTSYFILDTGSSLVWFPCTLNSSKYQCIQCGSEHIPTFNPDRTSSARFVGCKSPRCNWVPTCQRNCTINTSCPYEIHYASGLTFGYLLAETLNLYLSNKLLVPDFVVGCSTSSGGIPTGIAGFGNTPVSLPNQLGVKKFAYCLASRTTTSGSRGGNLVLGGPAVKGLQYTPFVKSPDPTGQGQDFYYIVLRRIIVGNNRIKVPRRFQLPGSADGYRGTAVDSGAGYTGMVGPIYELMAKEFERQLGDIYRPKRIRTKSGSSRSCFVGLKKKHSDRIPGLVFQFKGGAKMKLGLENYFEFFKEGGCISIYEIPMASGTESGFGFGFGIILGNVQQQNFYVEYDLENGKFGFKPKKCVDETQNYI